MQSTEFSLKIIYNGNGDVLPPIIIHGGEIKEKVQKNYEPKLAFVQTRQGQVNYDVPLKVVEIIEG